MPALLGFILIAILLYVIVSLIIPTVAGVLASMLIGKTAKLDFDDTVSLAFYFYLIQSVLIGIVFILKNDPQSWWSMILYFLLGLIWPLPYSFMMFGADEVDFIAIGVLVCTFVITQLIAILIILKKARIETNTID